jgi:hypothetical protein
MELALFLLPNASPILRSSARRYLKSPSGKFRINANAASQRAGSKKGSAKSSLRGRGSFLRCYYPVCKIDSLSAARLPQIDAHVGLGSFSTDPAAIACRLMSASPQLIA